MLIVGLFFLKGSQSRQIGAAGHGGHKRASPRYARHTVQPVTPWGHDQVNVFHSVQGNSWASVPCVITTSVICPEGASGGCFEMELLRQGALHDLSRWGLHGRGRIFKMPV
jgi:hypothetical protein